MTVSDFNTSELDAASFPENGQPTAPPGAASRRSVIRSQPLLRILGRPIVVEVRQCVGVSWSRQPKAHAHARPGRHQGGLRTETQADVAGVAVAVQGVAAIVSESTDSEPSSTAVSKTSLTRL